MQTTEHNETTHCTLSHKRPPPLSGRRSRSAPAISRVLFTPGSPSAATISLAAPLPTRSQATYPPPSARAGRPVFRPAAAAWSCTQHGDRATPVARRAVRSYRTISTLPVPQTGKPARGHRRCPFCCLSTPLDRGARGRYPPLCPVVPGLSSDAPRSLPKEQPDAPAAACRCKQGFYPVPRPIPDTLCRR